MLLEEKAIEDWLDETEPVRSALLTYSQSAMPKDAGERAADIEFAIAQAEEAGNLLADAEMFLTHAQAQAMYEVLDKYADLTARDRQIIVKDKVRTVQRLVDGLAVLTRTINSRIFANMNSNRSRL